MNKPKMIMMVGIPGSGKSQEAKIIAKEHNATIHASDELREELFGDRKHQSDNGLLFNELHKRIKQDLNTGKNVIYDATNVNSKRRMSFLKSLKAIQCEKIAIIMATPFVVCLENNENRCGTVPNEVIEHMYKNFQVPFYYEGFDVIQIVLWKDVDYPRPLKVVHGYKNFDQENSHHALTLGDHLCQSFMHARSCYLTNNLKKYADEIAYAALLHDCGKPFCKEIKETDSDAHYYSHMNVGAYDSLFYTSSLKVDSLLVAWLINWHMEPFFWEKDMKLKENRQKLWGNDLFEMIEKLHKADLAAH